MIFFWQNLLKYENQYCTICWTTFSLTYLEILICRTSFVCPAVVSAMRLIRQYPLQSDRVCFFTMPWRIIFDGTFQFRGMFHAPILTITPLKGKFLLNCLWLLFYFMVLYYFCIRKCWITALRSVGNNDPLGNHSLKSLDNLAAGNSQHWILQ